MSEYTNGNICPYCNKIINPEDETFVNGGDIQTGGFLEVLHKPCAEKIEEIERENGLRA